MNLTQDQVRAIEGGEAISILINRTVCVVLRKDVYEKERVAYDDTELTDDELRAIALQTFADADAALGIR